MVINDISERSKIDQLKLISTERSTSSYAQTELVLQRVCLLQLSLTPGFPMKLQSRILVVHNRQLASGPKPILSCSRWTELVVCLVTND
jgi:hypothetical protein